MFDELVQPAVILAASASLMAGAALQRLLFWVSERRHCERIRVQTIARVQARLRPAGVPAPLGGVPAAHRGAVALESVDAAGGLDPDWGAIAPQNRRLGGALAESAPPWPAAGPAWPAAGVVIMRPLDHVGDFLAHVRASGALRCHPLSGRAETKRSDKAWLAAYQAWAAGRGIAVIPPSMFLGLFAKASGVAKSRDRLKDPATCRVLRNARGTPLRATHYTVVEEVAAGASAPARRPAAARRGPVKPRAEILAALEQSPSSQTWAEALSELRPAA